MATTLNEKYLLQFSTLPNLSPERRQRITRAAFMAYFCVEDHSVEASTIQRYLGKCYSYENAISGIFENKKKDIILTDFAEKEDMTELLELPEFSCLIYKFGYKDLETGENLFYYKSVYNSVKKGDQCLIYWFRKSIISCLQKATEENTIDDYGSISLAKLCNAFNTNFGNEYGWYCNLEDHFVFLGNRRFLSALSFYCSKDIVIENPRNSINSALIRLRNHPDYLYQKIEEEKELAKNVIKAFQKYHKENPDEIVWFKLIPDIRFTDILPNLTKYVSYPSNLMDNLFAAIHYRSYEIIDFWSLIEICKVESITFNEISAETFCINNFVEMLSPKFLSAIQYWNFLEQSLFSEIIDNFFWGLNESEQEFLMNELEKLWIFELGCC